MRIIGCFTAAAVACATAVLSAPAASAAPDVCGAAYGDYTGGGADSAFTGVAFTPGHDELAELRATPSGQGRLIVDTTDQREAQAQMVLYSTAGIGDPQFVTPDGWATVQHVACGNDGPRVTSMEGALPDGRGFLLNRP